MISNIAATLYPAPRKCKRSGALALTVLLAGSLFCSVPLNAQEASQHKQSRGAQENTVRALQLMGQNSWDSARSIITSTKDPLAAKLYYWMLYTQRSEGVDFVRVSQFIRQNPEWPGMETLREKAERLIGPETAPRDVVTWFADYPPLTAKGLDKYLAALLTLGQTDKARSYLADWWAKTPLSRDDQRDLFRKYNRYMNTAAHHKRLDMLLLKGQHTNAIAIADVLQQGYPQLVRARMALAEGTGNVDALVAAIPAKLQNDPGLLYERLKWRRKNNYDDAAIQVLLRQPPMASIQNPSEWWLERHIIIRRLLERKEFTKAYQLSAAHNLEEGLPFAQAEWMAGWLALRYMKDPLKAFQHFEVLHAKVHAPISKSRASYWMGRAMLAAGSKEAAHKWMLEAAGFRTTFYGQLAAAELSLEGEILSAAPPVLSPEDRARFESNELVQVAILFDKAGMGRRSSSFLRAFIKNSKTPKSYLFAAELASSMKRYQDAINIAKDATSEGMFLTAQAYPVITEQLQGIDSVEWALIHSLIRQESVFDREARSSAGALGLMQLMPATAVETARKLGIAHQQSWLTDRPAHNIRLGTAFLKRLLDKYDGAYPLAVAAYNAGPARVDQWLVTFGDPRKGEIDIIDWIELIPIYETRNYVHRVVEGTYVYRLRLKNVQKPVKNVGMATPQSLRM